MSYRVLPSGIIETDTPEEAIALQLASGQVDRTKDAEGQEEWTHAMVRDLNQRISPNAREVLRMAVHLGTGTPALDLAAELNKLANGLGPTFKHIRTRTLRVNPRATAPLWLEGERGIRTLRVDAGFAMAYAQSGLALSDPSHQPRSQQPPPRSPASRG